MKIYDKAYYVVSNWVQYYSTVCKYNVLRPLVICKAPELKATPINFHQELQ